MPRTAKTENAPDTDSSSATVTATKNTASKPHSRRVLSDQEVSDIRVAYHVKHLPVAQICELFDLPQSTVYTCARGASYKHVPMPDGRLPSPNSDELTRRTKVSAESVAGIRADSAATNDNGTPKYTQAEIARKWNVSPPYVRAVVLGKFRING